MSREATAHVLGKSKTKGNHRLVMLGLAHHCPKEKSPFIARVKARTLADFANISLRYTQQVLAELEQSSEIITLLKGIGRRPNTYEILPP